MDVSGLSSQAIFKICQDTFRTGNNANFQVHGNIYPMCRVARHFGRLNHAVEWRYGDYTNVWISHRMSATTVVITSQDQVEHTKTMILRHNILCVRLEATGENPVNWLWRIASWACMNGFQLEHELRGTADQPRFEAVLRKPHTDLLTDNIMDLSE